jgi:hypothetical protein
VIVGKAVLSGVSTLERGVVLLLYPLVGLAADRSLSLAFGIEPEAWDRD